MGAFDKIGSAKATQDSNPVRPGKIHARITECKLITKWNKDVMMLVNMVVLKVIDGDHREGEEITHFMLEKHPSFLGNVKAMVANTLGCSPDQVGEAEAERIVSEENPLAGYEIVVKARVIKTRANNDFTLVHYAGQVGKDEVPEPEDAPSA